MSLRDKVDRLLASTAFREMLIAHGPTLVRSKPKQTGTTQRWKFEVAAKGLTLPFHTRVEFSRRGSDHQGIYGTAEAWDRICELVLDRLSGLAG